jgi:hypothetical protein
MTALLRVIAVALLALTSSGAADARKHDRLLDVLGTLQRPQSKADLDDPGLRRQLRFLERHPALAGRPVRRLVRLATVAPWGEKIFLVPTRRRGKLVLGAPATGGATARQIAAGCDWGTERSNQLVIVVPDGVVTVKVRPIGKHRKPVTARVENNIAAVESRHGLEPRRELWYGASGKVVKRVSEPCMRSSESLNQSPE